MFVSFSLTVTKMCNVLCKEWSEFTATNLAIDDKLLEEALKIGQFKSKRETVNSALKEFIQKRKQMQLLNLFGSIDFEPAYDYKASRKRK
jgi:Arc/MetJ family transcription regulator